MASFVYTARNSAGQIVKGSVSAITKDAASQALIKQGLSPVLVKLESKEAKSISKGLALFGGKVKARDLVLFTRQLSTMVSAGVPLARSLSTLQAQSESKKLKEQLGAVVKDVESGISLADALEKHPATFSAIYVNMVRAGEAGGILDDILKKAGSPARKRRFYKSKGKKRHHLPACTLSDYHSSVFCFNHFRSPEDW
jgi:type IV pilus assembly protein PilC